MLRRRLRLTCSSDEDEDEHLDPPPLPPPPQRSPQLSDDDDEQDFIDVSDHLSPPSPDSDHFIPPSSCPVAQFLRGLGVSPNRDWLDACIRALQASSPAFSGLDPALKGKMCFEQFLVSDMNYSAAGILPHNVHSMHLLHLPGPYVLQVDEIVNIGCPLKARYQTASASVRRCLKLSMTDGVQRVFGMEYRPIKDLEVLAPAGLKVVILNVSVRHGLLMLVPEAFHVLGGLVEELEAARQRLVDEVNKPPRGRRTRTGVIPPLASRATSAAWPSDTVQESEPPSTSVGVEPSRPDQGVGMFHMRNEAFAAPVGEESAVPVGEEFAAPFVEAFATPVSRTNANSELSSNFVSNVEEVFSHSVHSSKASTEHTFVSNSVDDTNMVDSVEDINLVDLVEDINVVDSVEDINVVDSVDDINVVNSVEDINVVNSVEDINMVDIEHPLILSGDREIPFTYLASLSAKWAASKERSPSVRGKIKCFLTGVKGFQFKERTTYELHVYVDDGSLISEVLINHEAVQKMIGHSPRDVTDALASSDTKVVSGMKETLGQFQVFLVNFEGTMLVEMNRAASLPIVIEMVEGCVDSDAWLLLRRLNCSNAVQIEERNTHMDPIDVSP